MHSRPGAAISLAIVCWKGPAHLPPCLNSLVAKPHPPFDVAAFDSASTDGNTLGVTQAHPQFRVRLELLPVNIGFIAAIKLGARLVRGARVAPRNPDAFSQPDWLRTNISP